MPVEVAAGVIVLWMTCTDPPSIVTPRLEITLLLSVTLVEPVAVKPPSELQVLHHDAGRRVDAEQTLDRGRLVAHALDQDTAVLRDHGDGGVVGTGVDEDDVAGVGVRTNRARPEC